MEPQSSVISPDEVPTARVNTCRRCAQAETTPGLFKVVPFAGHDDDCPLAEPTSSTSRRVKRSATPIDLSPERKKQFMEHRKLTPDCARCELIYEYEHQRSEMVPLEILPHEPFCQFQEITETKDVKSYFTLVGTFEEEMVAVASESEPEDDSEMPDDSEQPPSEDESFSRSTSSEPSAYPTPDAASDEPSSSLRRSVRRSSRLAKSPPPPPPSEKPTLEQRLGGKDIVPKPRIFMRKKKPKPKPEGDEEEEETEEEEEEESGPVLRSDQFIPPASACIDPTADDNPLRHNPKYKPLWDFPKPLPRYPYEDPKFDVRSIKLTNENFHPLHEISLYNIEHPSTQLCHELIFGLNKADILEAKLAMNEEMNERHELACDQRKERVPLGADYFIPDKDEYKYRQPRDKLGATFFDDKGKAWRKRPIPDAEWPRGLPHPEFVNGRLAAVAGAAYIRFLSRTGKNAYDWNDPIEGIANDVPNVYEIKPNDFLRPKFEPKKLPTVFEADAEDEDAEAAQGTLLRQHQRIQQLPKNEKEKLRLRNNIEPDAKRELERLAKEAGVDPPEFPKKAPDAPEPDSEEGNIPDVLGFKKPKRGAYGAFVVEALPNISFLGGEIRYIGQIANKFYSGLKLTPQQQRRYKYGVVTAGDSKRVAEQTEIPFRQIPSNIFEGMEKDADLLWVRLIDWLEEADEDGVPHWKTTVVPYWRAADRSYINPDQTKFMFDERNRTNLFNWLSEASAGLKMPASQIAAGLLAVFGGHTEDSDVASTNGMMNKGGLKAWAIVRRQDAPARQQLERWLFTEYYDESTGGCLAAQRHKIFFYDIRWLIAAAIHVFFHVQEESDFLFLSEATWHMGFAVTASITTSWNSAYIRWLFYLVRRLIGNRQEECVCGKACKSIPSLNLVPTNLRACYEAWNQRPHLFDGQHDHHQKNLQQGNMYGNPCIITDASSACFQCPAQFLDYKARNTHVSRCHNK